MVDSAAALDYYAILQVHPSADQEVIEAAFRQLMKKHHPDVAGRDLRLSAQYHQRAKVINQAHGVLRDPEQRRRYDSMRNSGGLPTYSPPPGGSAFYRPSAAHVTSSPRPAGWAPAQEPAEWIQDEKSMVGTVLRSPIATLAAAYYLLPGQYEWERGHQQELLTTCLLLPVGVAAFALATGRLAPWVGDSPIQTVLAWGILLICLLPGWSSLPRLAMASVPSVLLMSGIGDVVLHQTGTPAWLAWIVVGCLSLVLSARLYLFAVLPTLGACWLLSRLG